MVCCAISVSRWAIEPWASTAPGISGSAGAVVGPVAGPVVGAVLGPLVGCVVASVVGSVEGSVELVVVAGAGSDISGAGGSTGAGAELSWEGAGGVTAGGSDCCAVS